MARSVNRSQSEIQKCVGTPAQAGELEQLREELDSRFEGFEQRIDAIQQVCHLS